MKNKIDSNCCKSDKSNEVRENENKNNKSDKKKGILQGLVYGTIPHIGCVGFIVFSLLGVTVLASAFKPLMMKAYFFYIMLAISLFFACISAFFYLRKRGGIKKAGAHKSYLGILFGSTIAVSLILYMFIFPLMANVSTSGKVISSTDTGFLELKVDIPCPGHAPLIIDELKKVGVENVKFSFPNKFLVSYDSSKVGKQEILGLDIFKEYKASVLEESSVEKVSVNSQYQGCCGSDRCASSQTGACEC